MSALFDLGADPNAVAAKGVTAGTVRGSTPAVMLAATRGYYKVIECFKRHRKTKFLTENKSQQTILHVALKVRLSVTRFGIFLSPEFLLILYLIW